jgi:hypothetical protein
LPMAKETKSALETGFFCFLFVFGDTGVITLRVSYLLGALTT